MVSYHFESFSIFLVIHVVIHFLYFFQLLRWLLPCCRHQFAFLV